MNITQLKNTLIKNLTPYAQVPLFPADENRPKPNGNHVTFKVTTANAKGVGYPEDIEKTLPSGEIEVTQITEHLATFSFTTYSADEDESRELALHILDYFTFYGCEDLQDMDAVVHRLSDVINRDVFLVEDYERRNGFDVILRFKQQKTRTIARFEKVTGIVD